MELNGIEWQRFGEGFARRASATAEWEPVDVADCPLDVQVELAAAAIVKRSGLAPRGLAPTVIRSARNAALAAELGLTADELAQRLNDSGSEGTNVRVPDDRFAAIAAELGLTLTELRDRFAGRHGA